MKRITYLFAVATLLAALVVAQVPAFAGPAVPEVDPELPSGLSWFADLAMAALAGEQQATPRDAVPQIAH